MVLTRYPRIPHVSFSSIVDPDDFFADFSMFGKKWFVTEKMDGASISLEFDGDELKMFNRNTLLMHGGMDRQFHILPSWIGKRMVSLKNMLGGNFILFGEWLFHVHTVHYKDLPDWLLCYDIFDKKKGSFLPPVESFKMIEKNNFHPVPVISVELVKNKKQVLDYIKNSRHGDEKMEGVVFHSLDGETRVKYVTPEFKEKVDKSRHWKQCQRINNSLHFELPE